MKHLADKILIALFLLLISPAAAGAFTPDTYSAASVLSEGRWVRIPVTQTGLHLITTSELRAMGFSSPEKVRIYGYGGKRIPDHFLRGNYIDDLPPVPFEITQRGIVFYASATDTKVPVAGTDYFYHTLNPYSTAGYYFLTESTEAPAEMRQEGLAPGNEFTTSFIASTRHEIDAFSPAESGHLLLGEDFRLTRSRNFSFTLPDRVEGSDVWMQAEFFGKTNSSPARFSFTANGTAIEQASTDQLSPTSEWGTTCTVRKTFPLDGTGLNLGIECKYSGSVSIIALDHISLCYTRRLTLPSTGVLTFTTSGSTPRLSGASSDTRVWDVTDPANVFAVKTTSVEGGVAWRSEYYGERTYAAWNPAGTFISPGRGVTVTNQNLHGRTTPDMIILTHPELAAQSERIADMHRSGARAFDVLVVTPEEVYNEFGSGTPDVNAIRRMLKMFYDRGTSPEGNSLKYFLLMGSVTFDHRSITDAVNRSRATSLPTWQTDGSNSESSSYSSDDFFSFLEDNSGIQTDRDRLCIAVGRIPARNLSGAKIFTDRLLAYSTAPMEGEWRSRVLLLADDCDNAVHLDQSEDLEQMMRGNSSGDNLTYSKVYLDSDEKIGGVTLNARSKLHSLLDGGVVWWNYIGHASLRELSNEGVMTLTDVTNLYLRHPLFFYGATCSFLHWDGADLSGLEMLAMSESGGVVGGISAVRPVYISRNGVLSNAMGREIFSRDDSGHLLPVAEAMRRAKNDVIDTNKLRYVFLGDPAMRLAVPDNMAVLESVGGVDVNNDEEHHVIIPSLWPTVLKGCITDFRGEILTGFNGYINLTIYDAEQSFTTHGRTNQGGLDSEAVRIFEEHGERIYAGRARVTDGRWETSVVLPAEIADNFRPASLLMYAQTDDASMAAGGVSRSFYAYGLAEDALTDDRAPLIEQLFLNHETFESGATVNSAPMLIARISDDTGFNLSTSGIGHMMTVRIDETTNLTDVSNYFTPDTDGNPAGSICYQLPDLQPGNHTAMLKVWDVAGNSASRSIDFFVDPEAAPKIFEMYSDANPATVDANFYIIHNRPDAMLTVKIEVFDINGALVWTETTSGRADMYASSPVNWNLVNSSGSRVARGIYLYRATVSSTDNGATSTMTKRIAVAPM